MTTDSRITPDAAHARELASLLRSEASLFMDQDRLTNAKRYYDYAALVERLAGIAASGYEVRE